jgi:hypothetical protein
MSSVLCNLSLARLIYCSITASPEQRMIYSATVSKMDHWPRSVSVGRAVPSRKSPGAERLRRTVSQPEGNFIIIPLSWFMYWGILDMWGWRIPVGSRFSVLVQTGLGAHPAPCTTGTRSFPGVKRPGRGVEHPPSSSAEVKERVEL